MSSQCQHPMFINFRCIYCNKTKNECGTPRTVPFDYILPNLALSLPEIKRLRDDNLARMLMQKKLHLVLDLDHTLIHTIELTRLTSSDKDYVRVGQKQLKGQLGHDSYLHEIANCSYVLKKRPGTTRFLRELNEIFDLSIYTMGDKSYARMVADVLDPKKSMFKRVISRENCTTYGSKGLDVVLSHEKMILIVDDNEDVWARHTGNLIQIKPYIFFGKYGKWSVEDRIMDEISRGDDMDLELRRVLDVLKYVHSVFYDDNFGDIENNDVRIVLDETKSDNVIEIMHRAMQVMQRLIF